MPRTAENKMGRKLLYCNRMVFNNKAGKAKSEKIEPSHFPFFIELKNKVHKIKIDAYEAYRELPHPVLVHCSAGIDRSAPVAAFIVLKELNIN